MPEQTDKMADTMQAQDLPQQFDYDFSKAVERIDSWIDGGIRLLPNIIIAIIVLAIFFVLSVIVQKLVLRYWTRRKRNNLGEVLSVFLKWVVITLGFFLAVTIMIPTLKAGDLIAGLGVSSVAIGFAFKDILQNWLAGLLILFRQPFQINDQIEINGNEGTVERIETRATIIKTYDGQRFVIPNSQIYTSALLVKTAHAKRRSQYDVGIGYSDDVDEACKVIATALSGIDGVENDPPPEAFPWDLAASWVTIRIRWWTDSRRTKVVHIRASAIKAMKQALDKARIDMPYQTQVQLFHNQTESKDGDRGSQREGWPAPEQGATQPGWKAQAQRQDSCDTKLSK